MRKLPTSDSRMSSLGAAVTKIGTAKTAGGAKSPAESDLRASRDEVDLSVGHGHTPQLEYRVDQQVAVWFDSG